LQQIAKYASVALAMVLLIITTGSADASNVVHVVVYADDL
jgi:hypothetical protein